MNNPQFRQRRIIVERDDEGTITLAYDADTDEAILVDQQRGAILLNRTWYALTPDMKEFTFPQDLVKP